MDTSARGAYSDLWVLYFTMKLYTRTGDDGTTGLFGGGRVAKDDPRVEAYGTVDELNAAIGLARCVTGPPAPAFVDEILAELQARLFDLGADLATPPGGPHKAKVTRISSDLAARAERWIDRVDEQNAPMRTFVLPGGTELAARLHLARTVARRAERLTVRAAREQPLNEQAIVFLNRVSDLLFAMARLANRAADVADVPWIPGKS